MFLSQPIGFLLSAAQVCYLVSDWPRSVDAVLCIIAKECKGADKMRGKQRRACDIFLCLSPPFSHSLLLHVVRCQLLQYVSSI